MRKGRFWIANQSGLVFILKKIKIKNLQYLLILQNNREIQTKDLEKPTFFTRIQIST